MQTEQNLIIPSKFYVLGAVHWKVTCTVRLFCVTPRFWCGTQKRCSCRISFCPLSTSSISSNTKAFHLHCLDMNLSFSPSTFTSLRVCCYSRSSSLRSIVETNQTARIYLQSHSSRGTLHRGSRLLEVALIALRTAIFNTQDAWLPIGCHQGDQQCWWTLTPGTLGLCLDNWGRSLSGKTSWPHAYPTSQHTGLLLVLRSSVWRPRPDRRHISMNFIRYLKAARGAKQQIWEIGDEVWVDCGRTGEIGKWWMIEGFLVCENMISRVRCRNSKAMVLELWSSFLRIVCRVVPLY